MRTIYRIASVIVFALLMSLLCDIVYWNGYRHGISHETVKEIKVPYYVVECTTYNATIGQCDSTPFVTASGMKIDPSKPGSHKYLALSRDLLKLFNYGDTVVVQGTNKYDGEWVVADCMNKRFTSRIDLLIDTKDKGGKWETILLRKKAD